MISPRSSPSSRPGAAACTASAGRTGPTTRAALPTAQPAPADQFLGQGNGTRTEFQLVKLYASGAQSWSRTITKPVAGTVLDGAGRRGDRPPAGRSTTATGIVTFAAAPGAGVSVTAGFEFDVPVRFDTDELPVTLDIERLGSITSIPLVEVRR